MTAPTTRQQPSRYKSHNESQARTWRAGIVLILFLAIVHCWVVRFQLNPDGVSYVDMGRAMASADWATARNSTWSPLFPGITAVLLKSGIFPHTLGREWIAAHLASLALFFAALSAFVYFWKSVGDGDEGVARKLPALWPALGMLLFATNFIPLLEVLTPDIGVAAVIFAAAGLLVRLQSRPASIPFSIAFGALLGLGYLDKTVMFPIGLVALFALALILWFRKQVFRGRGIIPLGVAITTFLIVSVPWIWLTSRAEHRLTFGEAGRLAYAFNVSGYKFDENTRIPIGIRHEGAATFYQVPMRPGVTFSPWYDPAVLGKGIHAKLQMSKQLGVLYGNYKILRDLFLVNYGILVLAWLVLFLANPSLRGFRHWPLLLVALSGLGLYCAVLIEARYISAFVLVVFGSLLGGATLPRDTASLRYSRMTLLGATALLGFLALPSLVSYLEFRTRPSVQLEVAQRLQSLHLAPDEAVAIIGDPQWQFWPQAAHLRISGVVPPRQAAAFCGLEPALRDGVVRSLASAGAQLTVVELKDLPPPEGCSTLAGTDYCTIGRQP